MNILLVLIPVTGLVLIIAVALFFWAVNHQQFEDLETPAILPLLDDPDQGPPEDEVASSHSSDTPPSEGEHP